MSMLVLTRLEGEEIFIGDPRNPIAVVRVARIMDGRVRIGIIANRGIQIHRSEIAAEIAAEGTRGYGTTTGQTDRAGSERVPAPGAAKATQARRISSADLDQPAA